MPRSDRVVQRVVREIDRCFTDIDKLDELILARPIKSAFTIFIRVVLVIRIKFVHNKTHRIRSVVRHFDVPTRFHKTGCGRT